jgi:alkyl sulfatase BDS1-like metallo-beta-lactamase superfamily hydrolase
MHNVLTLRGAVIRDALQWSRYIDEAIDRYGDRVELSFASHSWPRWGRDEVVGHMTRQRDLYRWIHDEAMRLANLGLTPDEIAAEVELPEGLWADWSCHGYYGTLSHNVRAVYQRYLGFYDGHPSSLHPYPPVESGSRYVEFMGGMEQLLVNARRSYDEGDYRWVAQVLRHAVFADPANQAARDLQADAFEQLGYQAEAGPWRDVYLMGAMELRSGTFDVHAPYNPQLEAVAGMTAEQMFDFLAVKLNGPRAVELGDADLLWTFTDVDESIGLSLSNGTLHASTIRRPPSPAATISCARGVLEQIIARAESIDDHLDAGTVRVEGDDTIVRRLWSMLEEFNLFFPIIEP